MADSVTTPTDKTGRHAYIGEDSGFGELKCLGVHQTLPKARIHPSNPPLEGVTTRTGSVRLPGYSVDRKLWDGRD